MSVKFDQSAAHVGPYVVIDPSNGHPLLKFKIERNRRQSCGENDWNKVRTAIYQVMVGSFSKLGDLVYIRAYHFTLRRVDGSYEKHLIQLLRHVLVSVYGSNHAASHAVQLHVFPQVAGMGTQKGAPVWNAQVSRSQIEQVPLSVFNSLTTVFGHPWPSTEGDCAECTPAASSSAGALESVDPPVPPVTQQAKRRVVKQEVAVVQNIKGEQRNVLQEIVEQRTVRQPAVEQPNLQQEVVEQRVVQQQVVEDGYSGLLGLCATVVRLGYTALRGSREDDGRVAQQPAPDAAASSAKQPLRAAEEGVDAAEEQEAPEQQAAICVAEEQAKAAVRAAEKRAEAAVRAAEWRAEAAVRAAEKRAVAAEQRAEAAVHAALRRADAAVRASEKQAEAVEEKADAAARASEKQAATAERKAEAAVRAAEKQAAALWQRAEAAVRAAEQGAEAAVRAAEQRAEAAERKAAASERKAIAAERRAAVAEQRAAAAERRPAAAEQRPIAAERRAVAVNRRAQAAVRAAAQGAEAAGREGEVMTMREAEASTCMRDGAEVDMRGTEEAAAAVGEAEEAAAAVGEAEEETCAMRETQDAAAAISEAAEQAAAVRDAGERVATEVTEAAPVVKGPAERAAALRAAGEAAAAMDSTAASAALRGADKAGVLGQTRQAESITASWERRVLKCSLSWKRLAEPARGSGCKHPSSCNYDELREYVASKKTCPVCTMKIRTSRDIVRDDLMTAMLRSIRSEAAVVWVSGSEWSEQPVSADRSTAPSSMAETVDIGTPSPNPKRRRYSATCRPSSHQADQQAAARQLGQQPEVVDLC